MSGVIGQKLEKGSALGARLSEGLGTDVVSS